MQTRDAGYSSTIFHPRVSRALPVTACLFLLAGTALPLTAAEYNFELGAGLQYTDNVDRNADDRESEWILTPSVAAFMDTESPTFQANLSGRLTYLAYLTGTNSNTTGGELSLVSAWEPLPGRLVLHLENQYREVPADQSGPITRTNRERVNAVQAGPDLILRLSPVDELVLGARAGHAYFEESLNNTRLVGLARWEHRFSPRTEGFLEATLQDVDFEGDAAADLVRREARIGVVHELRSSELRVSAGTFSISRDAREDVDGEQGALNWDIQLARLWRLGLAASRNTFDAGNRLLAGGVDAIALGAVEAGFDDDLVTTTQYGLNLRRETPRRQFFVAGSRVEESFEDSDRDREVSSAQAGTTISLTPGLRARLSAWYAEYNFDEDNRRDKETILGLTLRQVIDRHYFAEVGYIFNDRSSNIQGEGFQENIVRLQFGYAYRP